MATFCLRNGHILSCSSGRQFPELVENHWLHVKNGRVEATGRGEPMLKEAVEEVDLEGRTVLPGLADSHMAFVIVWKLENIPKDIFGHMMKHVYYVLLDFLFLS